MFVLFVVVDGGDDDGVVVVVGCGGGWLLLVGWLVVAWLVLLLLLLLLLLLVRALAYTATPSRNHKLCKHTIVSCTPHMRFGKKCNHIALHQGY